MKKIDKYFQRQNASYYAAEIGNNHMGSLNKALALVDLAKKARADAVKFQFIVPELLVNKEIYPARISQLKNICLDLDELIKVRTHCSDIGIEFGISIFDLEGIYKTKRYLEPDFVKVASSDFTFNELILEILRNFDNVIVSSGMASLSELEKFFDEFSENIRNLILCYCVSLYPANLEDLNMNNILHIRKIIDKFNKKFLGSKSPVKLGYSDHSDNKNAIIASFALGCSFLEKHFTDDKYNKEFRDHNLSSTSSELSVLIDELNAVIKTLGLEDFTRSNNENENKIQLRRSAYYARDIRAGEKLLKNDVRFLRPQDPTQELCLDQIENKTLRSDVKAFNLIATEDFVNDQE